MQADIVNGQRFDNPYDRVPLRQLALPRRVEAIEWQQNNLQDRDKIDLTHQQYEQDDVQKPDDVCHAKQQGGE